ERADSINGFLPPRRVGKIDTNIALVQIDHNNLVTQSPKLRFYGRTNSGGATR
ncbi:MAG: hypothetical protein ACJAZ7_001575, partial [Zhongshania aliphaticivorans]